MRNFHSDVVDFIVFPHPSRYLYQKPMFDYVFPIYHSMRDLSKEIPARKLPGANLERNLNETKDCEGNAVTRFGTGTSA